MADRYDFKDIRNKLNDLWDFADGLKSSIEDIYTLVDNAEKEMEDLEEELITAQDSE